MDNNYNFTVYLCEKPVLQVKADRKERTAEFVKLTDDYNKLPIELYGITEKNRKIPTFKGLENYIENRTMSRNRPDLQDCLAELGLSKFDPWAMNYVMNGVFSIDSFWFLFEGQNLTWQDVKP